VPLTLQIKNVLKPVHCGRPEVEQLTSNVSARRGNSDRCTPIWKVDHFCRLAPRRMRH
jgi:hypothetical protein